MAAAQMTLAIEMNNRMKRTAAAMGFFLNVETQRKFLKMASNAELQKSNVKLQNTIEQQRCDFKYRQVYYREQYEEGKKDLDQNLVWQNELIEDLRTLSQENGRLRRENQELKRMRIRT